MFVTSDKSIWNRTCLWNIAVPPDPRLYSTRNDSALITVWLNSEIWKSLRTHKKYLVRTFDDDNRSTFSGPIRIDSYSFEYRTSLQWRQKLQLLLTTMNDGHIKTCENKIVVFRLGGFFNYQFLVFE